MPILGLVDGWAVQKNDFIVLDGEECEVLEVDDQGSVIHLKVIVNGDTEKRSIDPYGIYEEWGY